MHAEDRRKMFTIDLGASTGTTDLISYDWRMTMAIIITIIFLINPVHNTEFLLTAQQHICCSHRQAVLVVVVDETVN